MLHGDRYGVVGGVGQPAGDGLVEDYAQSIQVASRGRRFAHSLFRRHVARGAHDRSRLGEGDGRGGPSDTEVSDLRFAFGGEKDILRLYVAVDHAPGVGSTKRLGNLRPDGGDVGRCERFPPGDPLLQRAARHVLHRDVGGPVRGLAPVVDLDDVRVREGRRVQRLALEALGELAVARVLSPEHLEGHVAVEDLVAGEVHLAHPSATQGADDVITAVYNCSLQISCPALRLASKSLSAPFYTSGFGRSFAVRCPVEGHTRVKRDPVRVWLDRQDERPRRT